MGDVNSEPGPGEGGAAGGTTDAVRSLAVKHAEVRSKLQRTLSELAEQEILLKKCNPL